MNETDVRQAIFDYVLDHGIKTTHIAARCNMPKQRIAKILRGEQRLYVEDYLRFCDALQLPYEFFLKEGPQCTTT